MKAKRNLLIGIILGALIGWAFGFLRLPYIEKNHSFLLGFIACLSCVSVGIALLFVWNKNTLLLRLIGKDPTTQVTKNTTSTYSFILKMVIVFIVLGSILSIFFIYRQNESLKTQTQNQNKKIQEMSELMESVKNSNLGFLMSGILQHVEDELKNNSKGTLSDTIIARIAALSFSFKPYKYFEADSLSENALSPERGQLLLALSALNIDSNSFDKIKHSASFSSADLKNADLSGLNLSGADLSKANLWGANLNDANLKGADLKRSNLSWAKLNNADLKSANLDGANLTSAQLIKSDLRGATIRWAESGGAMLNEANLEGVDLIGSGLTKVNLSGAILNRANLGKTNLSEAILAGAKLAKTSVEEESWFEKLNEWRVTGAKEIQESYQVAKDSTGIYKESKYRLEKIKD